MKSNKVMKVDVVRLIVDCGTLDAEAFGAYLRLLGHERYGNRLIDNDRDLAWLAGVSPRRFRDKIRPQIIGFFTVENGFWMRSTTHVFD